MDFPFPDREVHMPAPAHTDSMALQERASKAGGRVYGYLGLFLLALVGTALLFTYFLREGHNQAVAKATADGTNLAKVLERQFDSSLRRLDADLQGVVRRIAPQELDAKLAPRYRKDWASYLDSLKVNFAEVADFYVVDAVGDTIYSSGTFKSFNVAERSHFKRLQADPSAGLVWTDVVVSKSNGRPTIVFARAIRNAEGTFVGLASVLVDLDYLQKAIAAIDLGPQGLIAIRSATDNKLLLRQPPIPAEVHKITKSSNFDRIVQGEKLGHSLFTSPLDGKTRYTTFLVLNDFPFFIYVALGQEEVLRTWYSQLLVSSVIALTLLLLMAWALWRLWRTEREREKAMENLVIARDHAEEASRSKGQFLANMSHEIRTPMNAILGMLHLLQGTELTSRQLDYASKAEGAAKSLLGLLNDILDFSKVEAGKMELEHEPFRLDQLLRDLSVVLSSNVGAKDIEVLYDVSPDLPEVVSGDALRLQQVLINLGGNAVKFTSQGQVVLAIRQLSATDSTVQLEFAIQDSGIGIAPENQAHIFSGFSQAEASTTRRFGGTGLGLAICKRLVGLMGGELTLSSVVGQGSTFSFRIDLPVSQEIPVTLARPSRQSMAPMRTLVIDDNPVAQRITYSIVQSWGWPVEVASSGDAAVHLVQKALDASPNAFPYPLILVDWQMPGMDGWDTARQLRQLSERCGVPPPTIIMVTGHGRDTLAQRSSDEQAMLSGFLVKPVTASMLLDAIADSANGSSSMRQVTRARPGGRQLQGMRVLVVEDNLINQQIAEELLSGEGAIVSLAANGQLGVEAVSAAAPQFDLVLMDVQMPVLDGYGATRLIREQLGLNALPIVAMTANAMSGDREACLAAGMNEHIGKPFDMAQLVSLLIRLTGFEDVASGTQLPPPPSAPLPVIEGLDLALAIGRMSGMRHLYVRTARDFAAILETVAEDLSVALDAEDAKKATMLLHTLKGNAGSLGALALAHEAERLEALCRTEGTGACRPQLSPLLSLVQASRDLMHTAIAALSEHAAPTSVLATDTSAAHDPRPALLELLALLKADDLNALQRFADVRHELEGLPNDLLQALELDLQALDLEAARQTCEQLLAS
ncbi:hybrid sensor histidine kinase/response regulator [Rhodoferax aquaticus]|uniref:Sensory/regulatory protein RpfC n=1 Tax=Rhodoferax aquaticus TaxID=2527691 RepID=A0A515ET79_9BURK|nr:hybrid sensor histidine kinase/response regulator [Rhodoferax aquaticus]QDL55884.1 hybrid sensor histidine kinase/response regulator [Rhodoferax aquaticus]